jgi:hydroxymethylbilane synthase
MLPISLRPNGRRAVIIGGGNVAARKAESLLRAGFPVYVVAERIGARLLAALERDGSAYAQRRYQEADLRDAALVVAATDDAEVNARVVADARAAHVLACHAADPELGDFTMPATQRIGDLIVSVDSNGSAPAFARRIARELAGGIGPQHADAIRTLAEMRAYVKETFEPVERAPILRALAERPIEELAKGAHRSVCATRRSKLAMIQSRSVAARLAEHAVITTFLGVTTTGDRDRTTPIEQLGETNVFVKELENAVRERRAGFAVHSCKDLAGSLPGDLRLAAISPRADARDAFCSERYATFDALPPGAVVGTSSPRRRVQLAGLRPDLRYEPLRGNVDTRLQKLASGAYDAIVLAMAGLERLGARSSHVVPFAVDAVVPAVGQGALAVETRCDDEILAALLRQTINDEPAEMCVIAERAALRAMRAGCSAPLGVHAHFSGATMIIHGAFSAEPGVLTRTRLETRCETRDDAERAGVEIATRLRSQSGAALGAGK